MSAAPRIAANTLTAALAAVALSWWLGLEQVLPGAVILAGAWRLWRRGGIERAPEALIFGLFMAWSLTSIPALQGSAEWLLYGRGEVHLLVGFAAYLVASAVDPASREFRRFLEVAVGFVAVLFVLSVLVATEVLPPTVRSPLAALWPGLSGKSAFVDRFLLDRQLLTRRGLSLIPHVGRQSLFFLYQGDLATVLLILGGWMLVARRRLDGAWRAATAGALTAVLLLVTFTGSRISLALTWGAAAMLAVWAALEGRWWRRWVVRSIVLLFLLAALVAVIPRGDGSSLRDGALWERVLVDFRVNSFLDRAAVYTETLERLEQRPLTGWGIQGRPTESRRYLRLGTHSELLNVAYRFGWVGLGLFVAWAIAFLVRFARRPGTIGERPVFVLVFLALGATAVLRTFQWDLNVFWLVMAFLGTAIARGARHRGTGPPRELVMLGARLHPRTIEELHGEISEAVAAGRRIVIGHQNLHGLHLLDREPAMRAFAQRADLVFLDGMSLVWMARLLGHDVEGRHRVTYADWLEPLAAECVRREWRVFHLGGRPGVGERAREALRVLYPRLQMETHPGYFGPADEERILEAIAEARPDILMVGMGMPRQEAWVTSNADKIDVRVIMTCGACMDYAAGVVATPPRWAGGLGLEWLFRLLREPRRLGGRYLVEPWSVAWRFVGEWWRREPARRRPGTRESGGRA